MIVFDLRCGAGHTYEEWFKSGAEFDELSAKGDLACPQCGDTHVTKALMAPAVSVRTAAAPMAPCGAPGPACAGGMCPAMADG
ncbi:MAG: DUF1178 family protein [Hyphomicrobiales bacterium]|nr:DUF1178 family protein [Hyphomicrobiales bacterium]MCP5374139.1 DUF1178 family protein [Hyphomicrobiales bacterium]